MDRDSVQTPLDTPSSESKDRMFVSLGVCGLLAVLPRIDTRRRSIHACVLMLLPGLLRTGGIQGFNNLHIYAAYCHHVTRGHGHMPGPVASIKPRDILGDQIDRWAESLGSHAHESCSTHTRGPACAVVYVLLPRHLLL